MSTLTNRPETAQATRRTIDLEFLYLDLTVCTRCTSTDANLQDALSQVSEMLDVAGVDVRVRKILVESEEQARALGFVSSPTILINGHDIALEFRESRCESCEECTGNGEVNCRVWVFQGREYEEAPTAMIVDAILREVDRQESVPAAPTSPGELSDSLRRFWAGKAVQMAAASSCCPPTEQASCCETTDKAECCGPPASGGCGCQ